MDNQSIILTQVSLEQILTQFTVLNSEIAELRTLLNAPKKSNYLTRAELAKRYNVSLSTVNNWAKSGKIKPLQLGGRVYFLESDVESAMINTR